MYICILWIPSKHNYLLKWFSNILLLYEESLYLQIYVETVKLKGKVLIFDYIKRRCDLLIDSLIKCTSINWNDQIIVNNPTWTLLQWRGLNHRYMEHSWSFLKNLMSFRCHWIIWVEEKVCQQFWPSAMTV